MRSSWNACLAAALVVSAPACGGIGGSNGDAGGVGGGGLTVLPEALAFSYVPGGTEPESQFLNGHWTASGIVAFGVGLPRGVAQPSWLPSGSGGGISAQDAWLLIGVSPIGLAVGTYSTTLVAGIGTQNAVVGYREVPLTLQVKPFGVIPSVVSLSGVAGSSVPTWVYSVSVEGATATDWTATADQPWITLSASTGTTNGRTTIAYDATNLAPGTYEGTVTFTPAGGGQAQAVSVNVALTPAP